MRALVFLASLVLAFFLVLEFYPRSPGGEVAGAEVAPEAGLPGAEASEEAAEPARFLPLPPEPSPEPPPGAPGGEGRADLPDWLAGVELAPARDPAETALAVAVAHAPAGEVLLGMPPEAPRAGVIRVVLKALEGDVDGALARAREIPDASLDSQDRGILQAALAGTAPPLTPAQAARENPLTLALTLRLWERTARGLEESGDFAGAARAWTHRILGELDAPWPADRGSLAEWSEELRRVQRRHRWNRKGTWPSEDLEVRAGDTLVALRKRYLAAHPDRWMCVGLIRAANQIPTNAVIHEGQTVRVPTDPARALVDLSARWCLYFLGDEVAESWPVGIGRAGEETPVGEYRIGDKIENPPWTPIGREVIPFGDPRNPLGTRWLGWSQDGFETSYGFHGTNDPESVGKASSDGCVRLLREDVERLFDILPQGAPVLVRD